MTDNNRGGVPAINSTTSDILTTEDDVRKRFNRLKVGRPIRKKGGKRYKLNIILFVLTVFTTLIAGAGFYVSAEEMLREPIKLLLGVPFSLSILSILLAHEMGHYITARINKVDVSLPYFIPAPTLFGTLGAVIKMRSPIAKKNVILDIGAAGPIAGMVVAIPIVILGLSKSKFVGVTGAELDGSYLIFGDSILFSFLAKLVLGQTPEGYDIMLHPIGFAGWVGLLVTALNLMPIGQLDGGHIAYAIFGKRQRFVSRSFLVVLVFMGVVFYPGWLIWAILLLIIGIDHPPVIDGDIPMDRKRRIVGALAFLIFILTFIPNPIEMGM